MSLPKNQAWFAAKRYGYGWGLPLRWQGWLVLFVYFALVGVAGVTLAAAHLSAFIVTLILISAALVGLCYWKGETPKWRWGGGDNDEPRA